jgi:hypothetical protein
MNPKDRIHICTLQYYGTFYSKWLIVLKSPALAFSEYIYFSVKKGIMSLDVRVHIFARQKVSLESLFFL